MSKVHTLFVFEEVPEKLHFFILEGDYRHLDWVYVNSLHEGYVKQTGKEITQRKYEKLIDDLCGIIYDEEGYLKHETLTHPPKDGWDFAIRVGMIL